MTRTFPYAALLGSLAVAGFAHAAQPTPRFEELRRMAPEQARELVARQLEQQKARRMSGATAAIDTVPPVLTKLSAPKSVDLSQPTPGLVLSVGATDDLSGLWSILVAAQGPSGQFIYVGGNPWAPTKFSGTIGQGYSLTGFEEPGTYSLSYAYLYDAAGNLAFLGRDQLVALGGRTDFTVKNKLGYDRTPPQLVSGKILTQETSLSASHPGTTMRPIVKAMVEVTDTGDTAMSGVYFTDLEFCLADASHCLLLYGNNEAPRRAAVTVMAGHLLDPSAQPGVYHLKRVSSRDYAGNSLYLVSNQFGGPTDFSAYFPSTTITLTP